MGTGNRDWALGVAEMGPVPWVIGGALGRNRSAGALRSDDQQQNHYHRQQLGVTCWFSYSFSLSRSVRSVQTFSIMSMVRFLHENQFTVQV